ncbi:IS481 family transposase, partial [Pseudomonas aeruginosa]|nr:IS481 family transposase [Pseudomonas aeruginosa]MCC0253102.1 IS481 family transposase [Pseudomonas aeruginosa]MCT0684204.1 IS481 family transposase [Pseudomonas aeruginosa]
GLPIAALSGEDVRLEPSSATSTLPIRPFDFEPQESRFPSSIAAKLAIAEELAMPLAKLSMDDRAYIDQVLSETLARRVVLERVRDYFRHRKPGEEHAS